MTKSTYRRPLIIRLYNRHGYFLNTVVTSVATALVAVLLFIVAPLILIGNTDQSGPVAGDPDICISSFSPVQSHNDSGPGSIANWVALNCDGWR